MPTSELSDALNPYYAQPRSRAAQTPLPPAGPQPVAAHHGQEMTISEAPRSATPPSPPIARATHSQGGGVHAVQELLRFLASTREAQEIERKRRIAWEQEQEAKYKFRQAEMERRMLEMQQEITALKARVAFSAPGLSPEHASLMPSSQQPTPSTSPTLSHPTTPAMHCLTVGQRLHADAEASTSASPLLPPTRFVNVNHKTGLQTMRTGSDSEEEPNTDGETPPPQHRVRRKNRHDTRCLTIQHAMRNHLLRVMVLETDKELPDSHVEGTALGPDEPVRFVWNKTPRQSVHNGRMKDLVLKDLKANRGLYRYVPDKDFGKKTLDSVFDQAFVTLRQKFKAQRDESAARAHKQREEVKAQRARRISRRKVKLGNRSEARNKMAIFEDVTFDGALQLECMSSEESEVEVDESGTRTVFRIRGYAWRSVQLQRFFDALDEEDRADNVQRPRRGVGRRERYRGPPKEGVVVPPRGVSGWMVSKRWLGSHGEVAGLVRAGVVSGGVLGEGSDVDE